MTKANTKILFSLKCHKNIVGADNVTCLVVGRWNVLVSFYCFSNVLSNTTEFHLLEEVSCSSELFSC